MARPIAYQPNSTSSLSKVMTAAPPTVAMMIAMAESRLVPTVSRSVRYEIQPIMRPKKTAPSPVIHRSSLLVLTLPLLALRHPLLVNGQALRLVMRSRCTARLPMAIPMAGISAVPWLEP